MHFTLAPAIRRETDERLMVRLLAFVLFATGNAWNSAAGNQQR